MNFFTTLTPAENLIVRDQRRASLRQMLEVTFMDLLLKRVLKMQHANDETADQNEPTAAYVLIGENYHTYASVQHEQIFLRPFVTIVTTRILLKSLIKIVYEDADGPRNFRALAALSPRIEEYFKTPWFFHTLGFLPLNKNGINARDQIFYEQISLSDTFSEAWNNDRPKAMTIIEEVKGNIFLLPHSLATLKTLGFELDGYTSPDKKTDYSSGGGCGGFYYSDYDQVSSGFGEGETSSDDGGSGDGGCGGDSGCGGCSGD